MGVICPVKDQFIKHKLENMGDNIVTLHYLQEERDWVEPIAKLLGFIPI